MSAPSPYAMSQDEPESDATRLTRIRETLQPSDARRMGEPLNLQDACWLFNRYITQRSRLRGYTRIIEP